MRYDCIVLGLGGIGSASLYHLASRGARVIGIDQYPLAHDLGSSHGDTRAIRLAYFEHPDYVPLLRRAYALWEQLNIETGEPLFRKTGILQGGPGDGAVIQGLLRAASQHNLPLEQLTPDEVSARFPGFRIDADQTGLFDPEGGVLQVEKCVEAHARLAADHGAVVRENETVRHWYVKKDSVVVETDHDRLEANHLVINPGPWAPAVLPALAPHLKLRRKALFWFEETNPCYSLDSGAPVFLFERGNQTFYGFPGVDEKGIKIAEHSGGRPIETPNDLDRHVDTNELEDVTVTLKHHLPDAGHQLNHHTTCMYTMTPDEHFLVGPYPELQRVSIVAGLSGHGFKFAPVLGEIMADLALDGRTRHPIEFLSPNRLAPPASL